MLVIRLQRIGKKGQPSYRLVVAEKRSKLIAPPVEDLGSYAIDTKKAAFKKDRVLHWIDKGAQPSFTVHNLLVSNEILSKPKRVLHIKAKTKEAAKVTAEAAKAE
ncbi:MAG: 30S ribosomal protein S16 [Candidatus Liptonbacteria bacterium]